MPSEQFDQARRQLDLLESTWISLLLWMGNLKGISPEAMVQAIPEKGADLLANYERRLAQIPTATFGPLHFVQFPDYLTVAKAHRSELESLGNPRQSWVRELERSFQECTPYRNDLQHAARFDQLPPNARNAALAALDSQIKALLAWWPDHQPTEQTPVREENPLVLALQVLNREQTSAAALAEELGFKPIRNPVNLIPTGDNSPLAQAVGDGIGRLYRVGEKTVGGPTVGIYLAYLNEWPERSAQRERFRRRLAKALTVHQAQVDPRFLIILADDSEPFRREIEIVYPRQREGAAASTVRATIELDYPTRYHRDLLRDLSLANVTSLREVIRRWNAAFNVERVTGSFFKEFKGLRDAIAEALITSNPDNPALAGRSLADFKTPYKNATQGQRQFQLNVTAFATRQLSRMLFLWFLQAKGWLGSDTLPGSRTFLIDLFRQRPKEGDSYFSDVLVPLFFDGLGEREHAAEHKEAEAALGALLRDVVYLPYVDGGLFRADADAFERALFFGEDGNETRGRVVLPDELFDPARDDNDSGRNRQRTVLGLLRSYRFTTQESTPDDQSVDPDPELLGKVFEDLYQADERHETGAYYTPREIVRYMCREALDGYLRDTAGVEQTTLDRIRNEAVDFESEDLHLSPAQESALTDALDEVTVVDPAVGSGAFLVGMLQEIVQLRRGIEAAATDRDVDRTSEKVYQWKRRAITHSLHGVDINPTAVEICRLRLWLSLVIEYDVKWLRDIPALPNLEFRIVAGDSLVDRMGAEPFRHSLPLDQSQQPTLATQPHVAKLDESRLRLSQESDKTRPDQREVAKLQRRMKSAIAATCRTELSERIEIAEANAKRISANPKSTAKARKEAEATVAGLRSLMEGLEPDAAFLKPLLWPLVFGHVFDGGRTGFDIVVANPPYVRQESLPESDQGIYYRHAFPEVYNGTADLYVFFFARALQLLHEGGWLAFITSNKYMRAAYGEALRGYLPKAMQIEQVLDFGDLPVFGVAAYPAVVVGKKATTPNDDDVVGVADLVTPVRARLRAQELPVNTESVRGQLQEIETLVKMETVLDFPQVLLKREGWVLEDPALVRLFERLMNEGTPLKEYVNGRIYRGVLTGLNEAFVIDQTKRDELVAADPRSADLIKPWLRGRDIKRWKPEWAGLYVIFTRRGVDIDAYPAIRAHMEQWRERLTPKRPGDPSSKPGRKPGDYKWYEVQDSVAYYREFEQPKVMWPDITPDARFLWDESGFFTDTTIFQAVGLRPAHLALLNSAVSDFILQMLCPTVRGGYLRLKIQYLETFPIPGLDAGLETALSKIGIEGPEAREFNDLDALASTAFGIDPASMRKVLRWLAYRRNLTAEMNEGMAEDNESDSAA